MIMIESEGITENVRSWRADVISAITSALPADKIMYVACVMYTDLTADVLSAFFSDSNGIGNDGYRFEAAEPPVFAYHIQNQGARANLFIDHSQIVQLACLRRGIWGTGSTFGKVVTFEGTAERGN